MILHEVDGALFGEACEGWDTADMIVWCIVHHPYHLHAGLFMVGKRYNLSSYLFHKHLTIQVIMVVSFIRIEYPD